jgi:WD40 repeat protein
VFLRQPTKTLGTPPFFSKAAFAMSFSHKISGGAYFSPDGRWLATLGGGKILLWDGLSGELRHQFLNRWIGGALCFTANSEEFVTRSDFNQMTRYDLTTGKALSGYEIPAGYCSKVLQGDDGKRIFMVLEGAGSFNAPIVKGITIMRRAPVKEGEPPVTTRLECWMP